MVDGDNKMLKNFVVTHNSYLYTENYLQMVTEKGHRFLVARKSKKKGSKAFLFMIC